MRATTRRIRKISAMAKEDATPHYLTLRGGRMTKVAGVAASFAPTLGSLGAGVSAIALSAALMLGGQAHAQVAIEEDLVNTEDPAGMDTPIVLNDPGAGNSRTASTTDGFGINTSNTSSPAISMYAYDGDVILIDEFNSNITGGPVGIYGQTSGEGDISISVSGNVTGNTAISVRGDGFGGGYYAGPFVEFAPSPLLPFVGGSTGDLYVSVQNSDGTAEANGYNAGIEAFQGGSGAITIKADNVDATNGDAVSAESNGRTSGIEISVINASGYYTGISARNGYYGGPGYYDGPGLGGGFDFPGLATPGEAAPNSITITATGTVRGEYGYGIQARNYTYGDVTIDATNEAGDAYVYGGYQGIFARNDRSGSVVVSANNVYAQDGDAIRAVNERAYGLIFGGFAITMGEKAPAAGPSVYGGDLTVLTSGNIVSEDGDGIDVVNELDGDVIIDASNEDGTGQVTGEDDGIVARSSGRGNVTVTADNVTGQFGDGIEVDNDVNRYYGPICCIATLGAPAASEGMYPVLLDGGDITITASGLVSGGMSSLEDTEGEFKRRVGGDGIDADNTTGGSIFITSENDDGTARVEGAQRGIVARNRSYYGGYIGPRTESITLGPDGVGVIDIHAQDVSGAFGTGIAAYNYGYGERYLTARAHPSEVGDTYGSGIFIEVTGSVEGGLQLPTYGDDGPIVIERDGPGPIGYYGPGANGITALQLGPGDIDIDATNDEGSVTVEGRNNGILAQNFLGDITIDVDNASGQYGAGVVVLTGPLLRGPIGPGRAPASIDAEVDEGPVIPLFENNITVTSTGVVEGGTELTSDLMRRLYSPLDVLRGPDGINVANLSQGDITITSANEDGTAEANGHRSGISAFKGGAGDITVTANNVEGKNFHGIFVGSTPYFSYYYDGPGRPTVSSPAAIEEEEFEPKIPEGNITISASGTVTGGQYAGLDDRIDLLSPARIDAEETESTGNFTYDASIQYGGIGIFAANYFTGDVNVDVTNEEGSASASGPLYGIAVANLNGGSTTITVDNAAGDEGAGVAVYHDEDGGDISVTTNGEVTGGQNGIRTVNDGAGSDTTISVGGVVNGDMSAGINAGGQDGTMTTITLREGADVSGGEYAILNNGSDSMVTVEDGAKLSGVTSLGGGSDALTIEGDADISDATVLDGGDEEATEVVAIAAVDAEVDGTDVLTFSGFTGTLGAGLALDNWEEGIFSGGDTTIDLAMLDIPEVSLQDNANVTVTDPNFALNGNTTIGSGSTLNAGIGGMGDVMLNGNVANNGLISLLDDNAGDMLGITGNLTGNGELSFDVDFAGGTNDAAEVDGNVTGQNGVNVNGTSIATEASEFTLVTVGGTNSDNSFNLANPNAVNSDGDDAIANGAFLYTLDRRTASGEFVLTPFDSTGQTQFNPSVAVFQEVPGIFTDLGGLEQFLNKFDGGGGGSNGGQGGVAQALLDFGTTNDNTFYMSITGQQSDRDLTNILRTNVDTTSTQLSMGFDVPMYEGGSGTLFGGFNFSYVNSDSDVTSFAGVGSVDTEAFGYTFSAFYLTDTGFYADGRYRFSFFDTSMVVSTGFGALGLVTAGTANSGSLEVGKLVGLSNGLTLIPQAQVQIVSVGADPLVDPLTGTALGVVSDGDTTTGRLGLWLERETARNTLFGSVSVYHDFDGTTTTNFAGIPFSSSREDTRLELGVGGELSVGQNSSVFGRVFAAGGLGDWTADETYTATAGFRLNF